MGDKRQDSSNDENKNKINPFGDYNNNQNNKFAKNLLLWLFIGMGVFSMVFLFQGNQNGEAYISYTQYKDFLKRDLIKAASISKSPTGNYDFKGILKYEVPITINNKERKIANFTTKLGLVDSETQKVWEANNIYIKYEDSDSIFWNTIISFLPILILFAIVLFAFRKMQGGGSKGLFSFGKARVKLMNEVGEKVTFNDVAGADEAKYELQEVIEFLKEPGKFKKLGGKIPKGVLLLGPPGTGKTLMARAVAGEADVPFFSMSGADFVEMFVGVGASRVRDLFDQAKRSSPCIVFIDEIDAVGRKRGTGMGGGNDEREQTLNQLLVEMDGFEQNGGVIIIAATNRPDVLDPALLRPGRFDRQVVVDRPDVKGREGIFKVHTSKLPLGDDVNLVVLSKGTPGLSGADIANIVNESALLAARRNSDKVTMYDFENAKDKVLMGIERRSMVISVQEKEMTAYHEMGHALIGKILPYCDPVHKVTIIPRGRALGVTSSLPNEDFHSWSLNYIEAKIVMLMGGRAAEKIVFNNYSTGASNDIERATDMARKMVCDWGMSEELGPINYSSKQDEPFLGREMPSGREFSESTQVVIDSEVKRIITTAAEKAEQILLENIELLHITSKVLIEREILDAEELDQLLRGETLPAISKRTLEALKSLKIEQIPENPETIGNDKIGTNINNIIE